MDVSVLKGKTLSAIIPQGGEWKDSAEVEFICTDGSRYRMYHKQDCCESVYLADVCGDTSDLIGSPLLMAEEISNEGAPVPYEGVESFTWTFYKFATIKGYVTLRWLGTSNGFYSESVDFAEINPPTGGEEKKP